MDYLLAAVRVSNSVVSFLRGFEGIFYGGKIGKLAPCAKEKNRFQAEEAFLCEQIGGLGAGLL
ncbi:MAG: hypothetical protein LUD16_12670 [Lachnospiraceae bacterium]|nr:hypothetical protein [Lachnospiraceae bacterium]